jgi:hypothetical protein
LLFAEDDTIEAGLSLFCEVFASQLEVTFAGRILKPVPLATITHSLGVMSTITLLPEGVKCKLAL